jgi:hypothetical protein
MRRSILPVIGAVKLIFGRSLGCIAMALPGVFGASYSACPNGFRVLSSSGQIQLSLPIFSPWKGRAQRLNSVSIFRASLS